MRGLKLQICLHWLQLRGVAPHTGAWIETYDRPLKEYEHTVAPHTGAWIETKNYYKGSAEEFVAPHTGAWIETIKCTRK